MAAVRAAERSESWAEAFVATQVWGYGGIGYGPHRTRQVLARPNADAVLTETVSLLVDEGAVAAYEALNTLHGLGPAFFTKFLYFVGLALPEVKGPRPPDPRPSAGRGPTPTRDGSRTCAWLRVVRSDRPVDLARQWLELSPVRRLPPVDARRQCSTHGSVDRLARDPGRAGAGPLQRRLEFGSVWRLAAATGRDWFARSPRRLSLVGGVGGLTMIGLGVTVAANGAQGLISGLPRSRAGRSCGAPYAAP